MQLGNLSAKDNCYISIYTLFPEILAFIELYIVDVCWMQNFKSKKMSLSIGGKKTNIFTKYVLSTLHEYLRTQLQVMCFYVTYEHATSICILLFLYYMLKLKHRSRNISCLSLNHFSVLVIIAFFQQKVIFSSYLSL